MHHEVEQADTGVEITAGQFHRWGALERVCECLIFEFGEGLLAKQDLGRTFCRCETVIAVHDSGRFSSEGTVGGASSGVLLGLGFEFGDLVEIEKAVDLEEPTHIGVRDIEEPLVIGIRAGLVGRQPHCGSGGLRELPAVGTLDQRPGEAEHLGVVKSPGEVDAGGDVAPLIGAAALQAASVGLVEVGEVVGLEYLIRELGEGDALLSLFESASHRFPVDHLVDGEVFAYVAQYIDKPEIAEPVVVIDHQSGVIVGHIDDPAQLILEALEIRNDGIFVEQLALIVAPRRIADATGAAAGDRDGPMSRPLQPCHRHHADEVADVER